MKKESITREQQLELECIELHARLAEMTSKCAQVQAQLMRIELKAKRSAFESANHAQETKPSEEPQPPGVED